MSSGKKIQAIRVQNSPELQHIIDTYKPGARVQMQGEHSTIPKNCFGTITSEEPFTHPNKYRWVKFDGVVAQWEVNIEDLDVVTPEYERRLKFNEKFGTD